ncbi:MAG: 50S ribosomal protein L13 [Candidatus Pacebacteria bacterium]|nr:50S ribosomal protein L13 [Candidatus Paceibacterota bacterium]
MKEITRQIHKFDATDKAIGRLASEIALILRGKNKPEFQPHLDGGDIVEVVNISEAKFTGKKMEQKKYFSYSGYPGGLKEKKMKDVYSQNPGEVLKRAVREMLPPVKFRDNMLKRLIIK